MTTLLIRDRRDTSTGGPGVVGTVARVGCRPDRALAAWVAGAGVVLLALTLQFQGQLGGSVRVAALYTAAVSVGAVLVMARLVPGRRITLGSVYLFVLVLFHCGMLPYVILQWQPALYRHGPAVDSLWLESPMLGPATVTVAIGILAFLTGYAVMLLGPARAGRARPARPRPGGGTGISTVAFLLLVAGLVMWIRQVASQGLGGLVAQDYLSVRSYVDLPLLSTAFIFVGLGFSALGFSRNDSQRKWGLYLFVAFTLVSFTIGFRGESVFAMAAWLVAAARRRPIRLRAWHAVAVVVALTAGSVVRQIRLEGLAAANFSTVRLNPGEGLAELGGTLHTVVAAREWHSSESLPFVGWGTYWAPLERLIVGRALGQPVTPVELDPRVFISTIMDRLGPLGGSPVAESYRAAGILGVLVVMALIGVLIGWLDSRPDSSRAGFAIGMLAYALLVWSRNDFTPVPVQVGACLMVIGVGLLLDMRSADGPTDTPRRSDVRPGPGPFVGLPGDRRYRAEVPPHQDRSGQ